MRINTSELNKVGEKMGALSLISPLNMKQREDETIKQDIDQLYEENQALFKGLAQAAFFGRFRLSRNNRIYEATTYYNQDKDLVAVLTTQADGSLEITTSIDQALEEWKHIIGISGIRTNDFEASLQGRDLFVLSVMMDLYRQDMFDGLANNHSFDRAYVSVQKINETARNADRDWMQWFAFIVKQAFQEEESLSEKEVEESLGHLVDQGLVEKDVSQYRLAEEVEALCVSMGLIQQVSIVNAGACVGDKVTVMGFVAAQYGVQDILMVDGGASPMTLETITGLRLLELIDDFLRKAPLFFDEEDLLEAAAEESQSESKFCIHCGKKIPLDAKFCPFCGGKV